MENMPVQPAQSGDKQKKTLIIIVAIVVGLAVLGWIGRMATGFVARKAFEATTGVKVGQSGNSISFQGRNGQGSVTVSGEGDNGVVRVTDEKGQVTTLSGSSGQGAKSLPSAFPADFPIFAGAALDATYSSEGPDGLVYIITWKTSAAQSDVADFYKNGLKPAGWKVNSSVDVGDTQMISFERTADGGAPADSGLVTISTQDGQTQISLSLKVAK